LKGEYGSAPAPFNTELQTRVLDGADVITCRPADLLESEMDKLTAELQQHVVNEGVQLEQGEREVDDVLTYALFPQVGLKFLANRNNPDAFEPVPTLASAQAASAPATAAPSGPKTYTVNVNGQSYVVEVNEGGEITHYENATVNNASSTPIADTPAPVGAGEPVTAPLAGTIWKVEVTAGQAVKEGDVLLILEAMKMETQIVAEKDGVVASVSVKPGDAVQVGDLLVAVA
jgi:oxaloacetate decarboxylase alpha subunit